MDCILFRSLGIKNPINVRLESQYDARVGARHGLGLWALEV